MNTCTIYPSCTDEFSSLRHSNIMTSTYSPTTIKTKYLYIYNPHPRTESIPSSIVFFPRRRRKGKRIKRDLFIAISPRIKKDQGNLHASNAKRPHPSL